MAGTSSIEWTDATWNPVRGCSRVSRGCEHCYAERQAMRQSGTDRAYEGLVKMTSQGPKWTGEIRIVYNTLDAPLRWRRPRRVFVNSMSDLFYERISTVDIASILGIAAACPQHTFQVLTKRPQRMLSVLSTAEFHDAYETTIAMYTHSDVPWPPPNVWLGVSVEDQRTAEERIPLLLDTPARVRWISAEPLLGPLDVIRYLQIGTRGDDGVVRPDLGWVVAGGESGPGARAAHPHWFRALRKQCKAARAAFFFKQWGSWAPVGPLYEEGDTDVDVAACMAALDTDPDDSSSQIWITSSGTRWESAFGQPPPGTWAMRRVGKGWAGRLLDGRVWNEYPA